ncbi:Suppressor Of Fused-like [Manis pentadactyla]|nr:Suppressor Of Fused-like [Manis pentadactyla]
MEPRSSERREAKVAGICLERQKEIFELKTHGSRFVTKKTEKNLEALSGWMGQCSESDELKNPREQERVTKLESK